MSDRPHRVPAVNFFCPAFGVGDGYGNSAQYICVALEKIGVNVALRPGGVMAAFSFIAPVGQIIPEAQKFRDVYTTPERAQNEAARVPIKSPIIFYSTPESWTSQKAIGRRAIGFTMFECDQIPDKQPNGQPGWVQMLPNVDDIIVPCEFNRDVFGRHFDINRVHVAPLGVNAQHFPYQERRRGDVLRFLHFSTVSSEYRKGADLAIKAFQAAFPDRDDVYLELNGRSMDTTVAKPDFSFDANYVVNGDPRIRIKWNYKTVEQLRDLYYTFDCLIYPSRGEGFGMIPLEAMVSGMPAIHSGVTGMAEYADMGLTVSTTKTKATIGKGRLADEVVATWHATTGDWYQPNLDELVDRMREVDREYKYVQAKAARDAKAIAQKFTWENTARSIQRVLEGWT